jgi:hypothetical protein
MKRMARRPMRQPTVQPKRLTATKGLTIPVGPLSFVVDLLFRRQTLFPVLPVPEGSRLLKKSRASERLPGSGSPVIR